MSKKCAKCTKTVYPTEELKCLDKIWHKACFKCEVCGMTLNMKNYKGYEKLPYCNAHYPQTKHTAVADTPESRRIAENTKIQSQVQYHADFEKLKGHKTSVAEDPEMARIKQNTAIQSNINYWGVKEQRNQMEEKRPMEQVDDDFGTGTGTGRPPVQQGFAYPLPQQVGLLRNPGKISEYDPGVQAQSYNSPYSGKTQANIVYDSNMGEVQNPGRRQPGSIANYDPLNQQFGPSFQPHPEPVRQPAFQPPPPQQQSQRSSGGAPRGMVCKALYDYVAADTDEVSFQDGDLILECQSVDAGWMTGRVERTGQCGMLPSNYVEKIN